jgi:glucokinase
LIREFIPQLLREAKNHDYAVNGLGIAIGCLVRTDFTVSSASRPHLLPEIKVDLPGIFPEFSANKLCMESDAKAAAYGEYLFGAGQGYRDLVCLTIGTGIGGGIIANGGLLHGLHGYAGHLGFMPVKLPKPESGEKQRIYLEEWSSGTAIRELAIERLKTGVKSSTFDSDYLNVDEITTGFVFDAARMGDPFAVEIISIAARVLGIGIATLAHIFEPAIIILGGGVAEQRELYIDPIRQVFQEVAMLRYSTIPIVQAKLGNLAGVIGAAGLTGF